MQTNTQDNITDPIAGIKRTIRKIIISLELIDIAIFEGGKLPTDILEERTILERDLKISKEILSILETVTNTIEPSKLAKIYISEPLDREQEIIENITDNTLYNRRKLKAAAKEKEKISNTPVAWFGGPCPISSGTSIKVWHRGGATYTGTFPFEEAKNWTHPGTALINDIIAFQILA